MRKFEVDADSGISDFDIDDSPDFIHSDKDHPSPFESDENDEEPVAEEVDLVPEEDLVLPSGFDYIDNTTVCKTYENDVKVYIKHDNAVSVEVGQDNKYGIVFEEQDELVTFVQDLDDFIKGNTRSIYLKPSQLITRFNLKQESYRVESYLNLAYESALDNYLYNNGIEIRRESDNTYSVYEREDEDGVAKTFSLLSKGILYRDQALDLASAYLDTDRDMNVFKEVNDEVEEDAIEDAEMQQDLPQDMDATMDSDDDTMSSERTDTYDDLGNAEDFDSEEDDDDFGYDLDDVNDVLDDVSEE